MKTRVFAFALAFLLASPAAHAQADCALKLHMDAHGRVYEGRHRLSHDALIKRLQAGCGASGTLTVLLDASPRAAYGKVFDLTGLVKQYGPPGTQFALSTGEPR